MNKYEQYKKVDLPWLEEIPEHWELTRVKNLFKIHKDISYKNEPTVLSLTRKKVKVRDISNNQGQLADSYNNYNEVKKGDLLLNPMDLYSGPNCNISYYDGVISPAYINLRAFSKVSVKYYDYIFKLQYISLAFQSVGKGVSLNNRWTISNETLLKYSRPLPPLAEQEQIAAYLDWKINEIDRLIAVEKEKIVDIDKYVQNKISDQYKNLDKRRLKTVLKESLLYGINSSGSEMGKIRFIRITDIDKGGNLKNKKELYIDECDSKYLLNKGDILLARSGATVGKAYLHINDENIMAFAGYLIRARVDQSIILPNYLYFYLLSNEYELWKENIFIQSTIQNISAEKYSNLRIPYVGKKKQIEIVSNVSKILRQKNNIMKSINETIDQLNSLKNSLISEVVTGRIDIRNVVIPSYEKVDIDISTDEEEIEE